MMTIPFVGLPRLPVIMLAGAAFALLALQCLVLSHALHEHQDSATTADCILCIAGTTLSGSVPATTAVPATPVLADAVVIAALAVLLIFPCYRFKARAPPLF